MIGKYIMYAGVEIEGGYYVFNGSRGYTAINTEKFEYDGSLKINGEKSNHDGVVSTNFAHPKKIQEQFQEYCSKNSLPYSSNYLLSHFRMGELVSNKLSSTSAVKDFIKKCWPDFTNETMSLHFHISFLKSSYYSCLMEPEFGKYFKKELAKFAEEGKINKTLHGRIFNNTEHAQYYCKDNFIPLKQVFVKKKIWHDQSPDRYTILNYCHGLHKTLECRVFTSHTNAQMGVKCWNWFKKTVEDYLANNYQNYINNLSVVDLEEDVTKDLTVEYDFSKIHETINNHKYALLDGELVDC